MPGRTIRRDALNKIARLSAQTPTSTSDLQRISKRCSNGTSVPEIEAILALSKAAPLVQSPDVAEQLLARLSPYLSESLAHILAPSPNLRKIDPSPYEVLTNNLTSAILGLGAHHEQLRSEVLSTIAGYIRAWSDAAAQVSANQLDNDDGAEIDGDGALAHVLAQSMSLLGFLNAIAEHAGFWNAYERLQMVEDIRAALSESFLTALETALSIVRSRPHRHRLREWRRYERHYEAVGRPLGAMSLHDAFLQVAVASAALLVETPDQDPRESVLDYLQSGFKYNRLARTQSEDALVEGLTRITIEEMERLDNDLEYLERVGSAWQQRQGAAIKAKILTTYLCCTAYDEDVADADLLVSWLDFVVNDPAQTAHFTLASTTLKSMAILAKLDSPLASTFARTLPRFIVQGDFDHRTLEVAADSLASVLRLLPQDAIITTLYSLGNTITAAPITDRAATSSPALNGNGKVSRNTLYSHQSTGSAISLTPSDVEDPHHVYSAVVQAVVAVAIKCKDEKVAALALSMLVQKIGRASRSVDAKIITKAALLGLHSGVGEFRAMLKVHAKLCHDAVAKGDSAILEAVSVQLSSLFPTTLDSMGFLTARFDLEFCSLETILSLELNFNDAFL